MKLEEGWYLMSTAELECALKEWREGGTEVGGVSLTSEEALDFRNAGNIPDGHDRSLRLVLIVDSASDLEQISRRRLVFEPDYHAAPSWRRPGSRPVNVVPLRRRGGDAKSTGPWWQDDNMRLLEEQWRRTGTVEGVRVPADYRGFVYKTVVALRAAGIEITAASIADSISRWVPEDQARRIRAALEE